MSKSEKSHDPIYYINQPHLKTPKANMQKHSFTRRESLSMRKRQIRKNTSYRRRFNKQDMVDHDVEKSTVNEEDSKRFQNMTIRERLTYLSHHPKYTPKLRCEITANNKRHRGIVQSFEDDAVTLIVQRKRVKISVDEITHVGLIGWGRR